jgi:hypothetical protein
MTDDDRRAPDELEFRLHAMLAQRADEVDPQLSGPALRARAAARPGTVRRYAPVLAAAAVVAGVAIGVAVATTGSSSPHPRPEEPGAPGPTSSSVPASPRTTDRPAPVSTAPVSTAPVAPGRPTGASTSTPSLPVTRSLPVATHSVATPVTISVPPGRPAGSASAPVVSSGRTLRS